MSYQIRATSEPLGEDVLSALGADEAAGAAEVSARPETVSLIVKEASGALAGYAVFGPDNAENLALFYGRGLKVGMGAIILKQLFGAAKATGVPLRVHVDNLKQLRSYARMLGCSYAAHVTCDDGTMQGIFSDG